MDILLIDKLLNKYFEGNTSLKEEEELKNLLSRPDLPEQYASYKDLFLSYEAQKEIGLDDEFDKKILEHISRSESKVRIAIHRFSWYYIASAAAILLIAVVLFVPMNKLPFIGTFSQTIEDTFDDPEQAYAMTMKTLLQVSEKMNKGKDEMDPLGKFNEGLADATGFKKLSKGVQSVAPISTFNTGMNDLSLIDKVSNALNDAGKISIIDKNKSNINNL